MRRAVQQSKRKSLKKSTQTEENFTVILVLDAGAAAGQDHITAKTAAKKTRNLRKIYRKFTVSYCNAGAAAGQDHITAKKSSLKKRSSKRRDFKKKIYEICSGILLRRSSCRPGEKKEEKITVILLFDA